MLVIALTGGIASGKSTVAKLFQQQGINIISADVINHDLLGIGTDSYHKIIQHFGHKILGIDKQLDKRQLRDIIFNHPNERQWLESLLHPQIRQEFNRRVEQAEGPYCIVEIPLFNDRQSHAFIDRVLVVDCPIESQLHRLQQRDKINREQAEKILSVQISRTQRLTLADDIISNETTAEALEILVQKYHQRYLKLSEQ